MGGREGGEEQLAACHSSPLGVHARTPTRLPLQLTALRWLHELVALAPAELLPHTAELLGAALPCLGHPGGWAGGWPGGW